MTTTALPLPLRHRIAGGAIGLCLAASLGITGTLAQEEATPEAEQSPATEEAQTEEAPASPDFDLAPEAETRVAERIQSISETIDAVRADRDAAGEIDTTIVDQLLDQAASSLDAARQSLNSGESQDVPQQVRAAHAAALAAEALIRAQLSDFGLPSQQAGASRTLDTAYRHVKASTERTQESTDEGVAFFVTTAQELYRQAYELYNAGTYAQAAQTARVAAALGQIAEMLGGDESREFSAHAIDGFGEARGGDADIRVHPIEPGAGAWSIEDGRGDAHAEVIAPDRGPAVFVPAVGGSITVEAVPGSDFSAESPIEVPEPEF